MLPLLFEERLSRREDERRCGRFVWLLLVLGASRSKGGGGDWLCDSARWGCNLVAPSDKSDSLEAKVGTRLHRMSVLFVYNVIQSSHVLPLHRLWMVQGQHSHRTRQVMTEHPIIRESQLG